MSGSKVPLEGRVSFAEDFDVPDVLYGVCRAGKTGRLSFKSGDVEKHLFLDTGTVVYAASTSPDDRLGTYLLQRDQLALEDLRHLSQHVRPGVRLGTLLVQHGLLPWEALVRAVHGHVEAIILSLFGWTEASYHFSEQLAPKDEAILLKTPTARLIVDGIDRVGSWERITRGLGSLDARFSIVSGNEQVLRSVDLDTASLELLAILHHPRSIREICAATDMPDIAVCRKLWAFRVLDWIRPSDEAVDLDLDLEGLGMILGNEQGH